MKKKKVRSDLIVLDSGTDAVEHDVKGTAKEPLDSKESLMDLFSLDKGESHNFPPDHCSHFEFLSGKPETITPR